MTGRLATAKTAETAPQALEAEIEVGDGPGEQEVERRAAALLEHDLEDLVERMPADEERQRLVLVRGPREQLVVEESRRRGGDRGHAEREPACRNPRAHGRALARSDPCCLCRIAHRVVDSRC